MTPSLNHRNRSVRRLRALDSQPARRVVDGYPAGYVAQLARPLSAKEARTPNARGAAAVDTHANVCSHSTRMDTSVGRGSVSRRGGSGMLRCGARRLGSGTGGLVWEAAASPSAVVVPTTKR
jgi:hypothetical protein